MLTLIDRLRLWCVPVVHRRTRSPSRKRPPSWRFRGRRSWRGWTSAASLLARWVRAGWSLRVGLLPRG